MNKFSLATILAIFLVLGTLSSFAYDRNYEPLPKKLEWNNPKGAIQPAPYDHSQYFEKNSKNKLQAVDFVIFDSLANSLSYHSRNTTPFVWDPEFDILATVKRGSHNPDEANVNASNSKNNLFIRLSNDKGLTWEDEPVRVYNEYSDTYGGARYPSMTTFKYENTFTIAYTCSLVFEAASQWNGYITGIAGEATGTANLYSSKCVVNGNSYDWGVSDGSMAAKTKTNGEFFILVANGLVPTGGGTTDNNGNIGLRKTVEFNDLVYSIPSAWASSNFYPVTDVATVPKETIGMRYRKDGLLYFGAFGNFITTPESRMPKVAFSTSNNDGDTWSNFTIMPSNLYKDYGQTLGITYYDSCAITYMSKDFTVLANGDVYFACYFYELDDTKTTLERARQIVMIKYEESSKNWSISKVKDVTGFWISLRDETGAAVASDDFEIEIAKTVDEQYLLVKYIDLIGVDYDASTYRSNDIYVTTHKVGTSKWSDTLNITDDYLLNRDTHIPEIIPNNLQGLPILMLHSVLAAGEEPGTAGYLGAALEYLRHQWVFSGQFDAIVGVEDEQVNVTSLKINRISPNPTSADSKIEFSTVGAGNVDIIVTDLLGNNVMNVYNGFVEEGVHSFNFNTNALINGAYYVTLRSGNSSATEIIAVSK
jgi:hypothetical protein